jgi:hypothetical protein
LAPIRHLPGPLLFGRPADPCWCFLREAAFQSCHQIDNRRRRVIGFLGRRWSPNLVQANGFRTRCCGRKIDRARHQREAQETSPTRPWHSTLRRGGAQSTEFGRRRFPFEVNLFWGCENLDGRPSPPTVPQLTPSGARKIEQRQLANPGARSPRNCPVLTA